MEANTFDTEEAIATFPGLNLSTVVLSEFSHQRKNHISNFKNDMNTIYQLLPIEKNTCVCACSIYNGFWMRGTVLLRR